MMQSLRAAHRDNELWLEHSTQKTCRGFKTQHSANLCKCNQMASHKSCQFDLSKCFLNIRSSTQHHGADHQKVSQVSNLSICWMEMVQFFKVTTSIVHTFLPGVGDPGLQP